MTEDKIKVFENLIPLPFQNELESLFEKNDDIKWSVLNKISRNPDEFKFDKNIISELSYKSLDEIIRNYCIA